MASPVTSRSEGSSASCTMQPLLNLLGHFSQHHAKYHPSAKKPCYLCPIVHCLFSLFRCSALVSQSRSCKKPCKREILQHSVSLKRIKSHKYRVRAWSLQSSSPGYRPKKQKIISSGLDASSPELIVQVFVIISWPFCRYLFPSSLKRNLKKEAFIAISNVFLYTLQKYLSV